MQIILDVYAGFLVLWNAMERPRSAGDRLLEILKHDGLLLMLVSVSHETDGPSTYEKLFIFFIFP